MTSAWIGLIGLLALVVALIALGILSRRLGAATHAAPYYLGFYAAALLVAISLAARAANLVLGFAADTAVAHEPGWALLMAGLPALGVTLGLVVAWRYWSWLLAERD